MVCSRGQRCALGDHLLQGKAVYVTNPQHVEFVRKRLKDFRPEDKVCKKCFRGLLRIYNWKLARAIRMQQQRDMSVSTSASCSVESSTSVPQSLYNSDTTSSAVPAPAIPRTAPPAAHHIQPSQSSLDEEPSTSAAAAAAALERQKRRKENAPEQTSVNVMRGARLPHIQPTPKRQKFMPANRHAMDIYLKGTFGG